MLSSRTQILLHRGEFRSALTEMSIGIDSEDVSDGEHDLVHALSAVFGNVCVVPGELGVVVRAAVRSVLSLVDEIEDGSLEREMIGG